MINRIGERYGNKESIETATRQAAHDVKEQGARDATEHIRLLSLSKRGS